MSPYIVIGRYALAPALIFAFSVARHWHGVLAYLDNLRKDINRAEKKKKASKPNHSLSDRAHISVGIDIGGSQISGKLQPDGTVKINMLDESSESDDIWADDDEEEWL